MRFRYTNRTTLRCRMSDGGGHVGALRTCTGRWCPARGPEEKDLAGDRAEGGCEVAAGFEAPSGGAGGGPDLRLGAQNRPLVQHFGFARNRSPEIPNRGRAKLRRPRGDTTPRNSVETAGVQPRQTCFRLQLTSLGTRELRSTALRVDCTRCVQAWSNAGAPAKMLSTRASAANMAKNARRRHLRFHLQSQRPSLGRWACRRRGKTLQPVPQTHCAEPPEKRKMIAASGSSTHQMTKSMPCRSMSGTRVAHPTQMRSQWVWR